MKIIYINEPLNVEFPFLITRRKRGANENLMTYLHFHDSLEISLVTEGHAFYEFTDKKISIKKGDCLIINGIEPHRSLTADVPWEQISMSFMPDLIWSGSNPIDYNYLCDFYSIGNGFNNLLSADSEMSKEVYDLIVGIYCEYTQMKEGYLMMIKAMLLRLLTLIYRYNRLNKTITEIDNVRKLKMYKIIDGIKFLEKNFSEDISLETVAQKCFLSPQYFSRIFKEAMGFSFISYLILLRINESKKLLINTNLPVLHISLRCGYNNIANFNYFFKKHTGLKPSEYRKKFGLIKEKQN